MITTPPCESYLKTSMQKHESLDSVMSPFGTRKGARMAEEDMKQMRKVSSVVSDISSRLQEQFTSTERLLEEMEHFYQGSEIQSACSSPRSANEEAPKQMQRENFHIDLDQVRDTVDALRADVVVLHVMHREAQKQCQVLVQNSDACANGWSQQVERMRCMLEEMKQKFQALEASSGGNEGSGERDRLMNSVSEMSAASRALSVELGERQKQINSLRSQLARVDEERSVEKREMVSLRATIEERIENERKSLVSDNMTLKMSVERMREERDSMKEQLEGVHESLAGTLKNWEDSHRREKDELNSEISSLKQDKINLEGQVTLLLQRGESQSLHAGEDVVSQQAVLLQMQSQQQEQMQRLTQQYHLKQMEELHERLESAHAESFKRVKEQWAKDKVEMEGMYGTLKEENSALKAKLARATSEIEVMQPVHQEEEWRQLSLENEHLREQVIKLSSQVGYSENEAAEVAVLREELGNTQLALSGLEGVNLSRQSLLERREEEVRELRAAQSEQVVELSRLREELDLTLQREEQLRTELQQATTNLQSPLPQTPGTATIAATTTPTTAALTPAASVPSTPLNEQLQQAAENMQQVRQQSEVLKAEMDRDGLIPPTASSSTPRSPPKKLASALALTLENPTMQELEQCVQLLTTELAETTEVVGQLEQQRDRLLHLIDQNPSVKMLNQLIDKNARLMRMVEKSEETMAIYEEAIRLLGAEKVELEIRASEFDKDRIVAEEMLRKVQREKKELQQELKSSLNVSRSQQSHLLERV
jgi:chromosome segregation ATPase